MEIVLPHLFGKVKEERKKRYFSIFSNYYPKLLGSERYCNLFDTALSSFNSEGVPPSFEFLATKFDVTEVKLLVDNFTGTYFSFVEFEDYLKDLNEKFNRATLINGMSELTADLVDKPVEQVRAKLKDLIKEEKPEDIVILGQSPIAETYEKKSFTGPMVYIKEYDEIIGGTPRGSLISVFGFVKAYKSIFALNYAYNNAMNLNYNVLYYSLEMSRKQLELRFLLRHSVNQKFKNNFMKVEAKALRQKLLSEKEKHFLFGEVYKDFNLSKGRILIHRGSSGDRTDDLEQLIYKSDALVSGGLDIVILDYMQLFGMGSRDKNTVVNSYVKWAKDFAEHFDNKRGLVFLILAQANRDGWKRAIKNQGVYDLASIAEINEIERSSDLVFSTFVDDTLKQSMMARMQLLAAREVEDRPEPLDVFADPSLYYIGDFIKPEVTKEELMNLI